MNNHYGIIAYALDRQPGGIGRYTIELMRSLQDVGAKLTILHAGATAQRNGVVSLRGSRLLPGLLSIGQIEIGWAAAHNNLAIVHDPTGCAPLMLTGAQRVATIHDVIPYIYPQTSSRLDWLIYRFWLPLAVRHLDAIITDSTCSKNDILRYLPVQPERVFVIPIAANSAYRVIEQAAYTQTLARYGVDFPYILYVGSLEARKNLTRLLEAYHRLRNWSTQWRLVVVGARKWKFSPIFETVQRLGLEAHVHFTGYIEEADLPAFYNGADLLAFPSLYEGFGLPILEAMACGTPVVTATSSSLPEVAGDAAILVDPYDSAAIAAGMRRVLENPDLAAMLRELGLARAQQFSWERTARETIAVYERVQNKLPASPIRVD
ncbi:MAG: glycosyltransferase family 4 protein [Chloroflexales bacterium]|nr:glycosyltransferase family 4 protein [Chloroflexales bacterium]